MARPLPSLPKDRKPCSLPNPDSTDSFWHSEPAPLLIGHRSTRQLPNTADVVIIGSGMTGTSAAYHLFRSTSESAPSQAQSQKHPSPSVVMLEAREACWGATGRNGGHCQPLLFEDPHDPSIGHFELANFRALQSLIADEGIEEAEFVEQRGVRAIYDKRHLDDAEMALAIMKTTAPELSGMMKFVTDKKELESYRIPTALGAVVTSVAARMWPYKFVSHVLTSLLTSNDLNGSFNLQTLTPAEAVTASNSETGSWCIKTPRGTIQAKKVILCTNAYTSHLLPDFADLIVPCRGQMSALIPLPSLQGEGRLKTSLGFLGDDADDYLIQRPNEKGGHMMFGGGRHMGESLGVTDDSVIDESTAKYLRTRLVTALGLPESKDKAYFMSTHMWTGIMGFSRDERPWVGPVPEHRNMYIAAGFTGHGMPNTWLSGKAVALMAGNSLHAETEKHAQPSGEASYYGQDEEWIVEQACAAVGLPKGYRCTSQRMRDAMSAPDVQVGDWVEKERERRQVGGEGRRVPSGYA